MAKDKTPAYDTADLLFGGNNDGLKTKEVTKTTQAKQNITYRQKRDKRLQVVMTQELYDRLQAEKDATGAKSINEIVNTILDNGLKKRG